MKYNKSELYSSIATAEHLYADDRFLTSENRLAIVQQMEIAMHIQSVEDHHRTEGLSFVLYADSKRRRYRVGYLANDADASGHVYFVQVYDPKMQIGDGSEYWACGRYRHGRWPKGLRTKAIEAMRDQIETDRLAA
ncbi:MAG: hypothetical protein KF826_12345 [Xanthobacteraceae bacterium]|nr:hypothetical protein [Xanthobacteraceae bacterium]